MSNTTEVTDVTFQNKVKESSEPVLVDFWAPWCGPCKMIAPILEQIAEEQKDKLTIVKVNVDENPQIASEYQIMAIPTLLLFKDGKVVQTIKGLKSKNALLSELEPHI